MLLAKSMIGCQIPFVRDYDAAERKARQTYTPRKGSDVKYTKKDYSPSFTLNGLDEERRYPFTMLLQHPT